MLYYLGFFYLITPSASFLSKKQNKTRTIIFFIQLMGKITLPFLASLYLCEEVQERATIEQEE